MATRLNDKYSDYRFRLGQNIARIRKQETGYTQEEMETYACISRAYYGRIELGIHAVSVDVLLKIAEALNVPIQRLFVNENNEPIWSLSIRVKVLVTLKALL